MRDLIIQLSEVNYLYQYIGVFLIGAIPFLEAFLAAAVGKIIGVSLVFGIIGNWISVMLIILPFDALLTRIRNRKSKEKGFIQNRVTKASELYEKYGVPGGVILTPLVASGHIAAFASLVAGASKERVIIWHTVSIVIWGVIGAVFGNYLRYDIIQ